MSDFEDDVRRALAGHADDAPADASGLAQGARARRRNRRRAVGGAVVAAALVAAIPVGLTLVNNDDSDGQRVADGPSTGESQSGEPTDDVTSAPDGWRWESWRNVEVMVPQQWRDGSAYDLCIPGHPSPPPGNVARDGYLADFEPDEATQAICAQGVTFLAGDPTEPITVAEGSVGDRVQVGGNTVDVVAADQETLDQIVESAHEIEETDSLGCAPQIEQGKGNYGEAEGDVVVCEYVVGGYGSDRSTPVLDSSATLKERDAKQVRDIPHPDHAAEQPERHLRL